MIERVVLSDGRRGAELAGERTADVPGAGRRAGEEALEERERVGEDVVDERVRVGAGELGSGGCGDEVDVDEGSEPVLSREDAPEAVLEEELVDGDERPAGVVREPEELVGRRRIGRERLLDDHVRAGRERGPDDLGVGVERRADVDDVDLVRGKRGLEVDVGRPDAQSHGGRELTVDDGDDRSVRATGSGRVPAPHRACADDRRAHALPAPFADARHAATLLRRPARPSDRPRRGRGAVGRRRAYCGGAGRKGTRRSRPRAIPSATAGRE